MRSGLSRRTGSGLGRALFLVLTGASDPLAIETDLAGNLADGLFVLVDGLEGGLGERLARLLFGFHGRPVGAAKSSKGLPALVIHALIVPQGVRHYLAACIHDTQSAILNTASSSAYCATG